MFKSFVHNKRGRSARLLAVATVLTVLLTLIIPAAAFGETPDATDADATSEVDSSLQDATAEAAVGQLEAAVESLATVTATLPKGKVGVAYVGLTSDFDNAWRNDLYIISGDLPEGVILDDDGSGIGILTGTPTTAGTYQFTVQEMKSPPTVDNEWIYTLTIDPRDTIVLPGGKVGDAYSESDTIYSDSGITSAVLSGGSLPTGLALNATVTSDPSGQTISIAITGNPTAAGTYTFAVQLWEGASAAGDPYTYSISIVSDIAPLAGIGSPRTGDETPILVFLVLFVIAAAGIVISSSRLRKTYEKKD